MKRKIIEELFDSFFERYQEYQEGLKESMEKSKFAFVGVDLLYYKCHRVSLNCGGSCIDSPKWIKNKKATINLKNNDNKCFQYSFTVSLNYQRIKKGLQRILKIKPFIDQYNYKTFHRIKTGKTLNQIINQLLLISYMYLTTLKK